MTITKNNKRNGQIAGFTNDGLMFDATVKGNKIASMTIADRETGLLAYYYDNGAEGSFEDVLAGRSVSEIRYLVLQY